MATKSRDDDGGGLFHFRNHPIGKQKREQIPTAEEGYYRAAGTAGAPEVRQTEKHPKCGAQISSPVQRVMTLVRQNSSNVGTDCGPPLRRHDFNGRHLPGPFGR
jgi:hypothetical protein